MPRQPFQSIYKPGTDSLRSAFDNRRDRFRIGHIDGMDTIAR